MSSDGDPAGRAYVAWREGDGFWTYLACAAFLMLVALLAAYLPAWRAARIEAMDALRYE